MKVKVKGYDVEDRLKQIINDIKLEVYNRYKNILR